LGGGLPFCNADDSLGRRGGEGGWDTGFGRLSSI